MDALCVDQHPTIQQIQQLAMMDVIYQGSTVTIIAMSGEDSDAGLPGVSSITARVPQGVETIEGKEILVIFPTLVQEMENARYQTRAWTMQEALLSRCRLVFTKYQAHWRCNSADWCESIDETDDTAHYTDSYYPEKCVEPRPHPHQHSSCDFEPSRSSQQYTVDERLSLGEADYRECVENYTSRQLTKDSDSLNAFLGIVSYLCKAWLPNGFIWGMPLQDFPQSLRWFHPRQVKPRRRAEFPSWSWCGWEGQATYSASLDSEKANERGRFDPNTDMTVKFISIDNKVLTLEGYLVTLDIRTDPFSEAFVPDTEESLGPVRERNFLHNNTLPSGRYPFLVVERLKYKSAMDRPIREDVFMLLLEWDREVAVRKTKVRLSLDPGMSFDVATARLGVVRLE